MKKAVITGINQETRIDLIRAVLEPAYDVNVLVQDFDHVTRDYKLRRREDYEYIHMPRFRKNLSAGRIKSYIRWSANVYRRICEIRPDVLYVILPPNALAWHSMRYCRRHPGVKLITDIYNLWPEALPVTRFAKAVSLPTAVWKDMRNRALNASALTFTECNLYRDILSEQIDVSRFVTLYLCKPQEEFILRSAENRIEAYEAKCAGQRDVRRRGVHFGYLGNLNNIIDIDGMCSIVQRVCALGVPVRCSVIGKGEQEQTVVSRLEQAGAQVSFYGPIYDEGRKLEILSETDFCFNMFKSSVVVGLTTKSTDYFSLGVPIINTIRGDTWDFVRTYGVGINDTGKNAKEILSAIETGQVVSMRRSAFALYHRLFTRQVLSGIARNGFQTIGIL